MEEKTNNNALSLVADRTRIANIVHNDVVGRFVTYHEKYFRVNFFGWEMGNHSIIYDSVPSVIYLIKKSYLTADQFKKLLESARRIKKIQNN